MSFIIELNEEESENLQFVLRYIKIKQPVIFDEEWEVINKVYNELSKKY